MKRIVMTLALLTASATAQTGPNNTIGMLYDAGGKFDKSFNQSAYEGTLRVQKQLGMKVTEHIGSGSATEESLVGALRTLVQQGAGIAVGMGYANVPRMEAVSKEFPDRHFVVVDDVANGDNVTSVVFREEEGSFLAGYIAAQTTATGKVAFIGGMNIPLIQKFAAGFKSGVIASGKPITVQSVYVGTTPEAWNNPTRAAEITRNLAAKGFDVFYGAAGASGTGVIDTVNKLQCLKASALPAGVKFQHNRFSSVPKSAGYQKACAGDTRPLFFIGVDSNQNYLGDTDKNPATLNHGLTSMVKRVDNAVYSVASQFKQGTLKGGTLAFGLKEGGVSYAVDEYNRALLSRETLQRTEKLKARIIRGLAKVASK